MQPLTSLPVRDLAARNVLVWSTCRRPHFRRPWHCSRTSAGASTAGAENCATALTMHPSQALSCCVQCGQNDMQSRTRRGPPWLCSSPHLVSLNCMHCAQVVSVIALTFRLLASHADSSRLQVRQLSAWHHRQCRPDSCLLRLQPLIDDVVGVASAFRDDGAQPRNAPQHHSRWRNE